MADVPSAVRAHQDEGYLELCWGETVWHYPYKFLRGQCPCAECVDEDTGVRKLDVDSISDQIRPMHLSFSGNYALKIHWNDGHQTGLYTWDHFQRLSRDPVVTSPEPDSL
ncbi:MAG: DUF971 domain-containing protein [Planctomycetaceae bacterium]|nr:DUF971 domain-containing protein [Planctomycetaceae bacterium]